MGTVTYRNGIAILQLIIFPFILVAGVFIWSRSGWRIGSRIWRYPVTLSLIRIAGCIASLVSIDHDSHDTEVAVAVCELIGIAPLLLTYVGILRQIDTERRMPPRCIPVVTIICIVGLILGIAGFSSAHTQNGEYHPSSIVKASMGIFLAVFGLVLLLTAFLYLQLQGGLRVFQKKLFLAIALSMPFLLVRMVYSAISDYGHDSRFTVLVGDPTVYLCMSVLEEIVAMVLTMVLGVSAVREADFVRVSLPQENSGRKVEGV